MRRRPRRREPRFRARRRRRWAPLRARVLTKRSAQRSKRSHRRAEIRYECLLRLVAIERIDRKHSRACRWRSRRATKRRRKLAERTRQIFPLRTVSGVDLRTHRERYRTSAMVHLRVSCNYW